MAGGLLRLWPQVFKKATVVDECGGAYNTLRVHDISQLEQPLPSSRRTSLWAHQHECSGRWVWRVIWDHLHNGGEVTEAARTIGIMTGLGPPASG
jgi:hypothetical protein